MALGKLGELASILENPQIVKVFHGCDFDLRMLNSNFKCRPMNIFDTQIAAQLIGLNEIGLGSLLDKYLNLSKKDKFQMADWTKRPLTPEMIEYAAKDSRHLIRLKEILSTELKQKNRLDWAVQEFKHLEKTSHELHEPSFWDFRGLKKLTDKQRSILKELYDAREYLAKKVNRPVHFIMNSKKLLQFSINPPTYNEWKNMKGVHPIVRRDSYLLDKAVKKGLEKELKMPKQKIKRFTKKQRDIINKITEIRNKEAEKLGIEPFLIINKEQMYEIVLTDSLSSLRDWQKEIISKKINFNSN
jgi:ribonuclease D